MKFQKNQRFSFSLLSTLESCNIHKSHYTLKYFQRIDGPSKSVSHSSVSWYIVSFPLRIKEWKSWGIALRDAYRVPWKCWNAKAIERKSQRDIDSPHKLGTSSICRKRVERVEEGAKGELMRSRISLSPSNRKPLSDARLHRLPFQQWELRQHPLLIKNTHKCSPQRNERLKLFSG